MIVIIRVISVIMIDAIIRLVDVIVAMVVRMYTISIAVVSNYIVMPVHRAIISVYMMIIAGRRYVARAAV